MVSPIRPVVSPEAEAEDSAVLGGICGSPSKSGAMDALSRRGRLLRRKLYFKTLMRRGESFILSFIQMSRHVDDLKRDEGVNGKFERS